VFILALLAFFAIALPDNMLGTAWPFMRVTFDQPLAAMSLVLPFGVAATLVSTSGWTWAAARLGLGRLLGASLALSTAGLLLTAVAPAYWVVVACAVLFGLSAGAIDAALNAYAARHFGPSRINRMHAAYGVGAATSPLIMTAAVSFGPSWRGAYLAVMILQGLLAVLFTVTARRWATSARDTDPAAPATPPANASAQWRPPRRAVAGLLVVAVNTGLESVVALWGFVFLLDAVALPTATAGLVMSGYWAALVVGRILLGAATERIGIWPMLAGVTTATVLAAALVATQLPVLAGVGVIVLGLAVAPIYPLLILTTSERTTSGSLDRLVGFQAGASTVGAVTFTALVGLLMGVDTARFGGSVLALALLSSTGIWVLRPGRHRPGASGRQRDGDQGESPDQAAESSAGRGSAPRRRWRRSTSR
jgi:MFS family permease